MSIWNTIKCVSTLISTLQAAALGWHVVQPIRGCTKMLYYAEGMELKIRTFGSIVKVILTCAVVCYFV